MKNFGIFLESK